MSERSWMTVPVEYSILVDGELYTVRGKPGKLGDLEEKQVNRWTLSSGEATVYVNRLDLVEGEQADELTQAAYFLDRLFATNAAPAREGSSYQVSVEDRKALLGEPAGPDELVARVLDALDVLTYVDPELGLSRDELALTLRVEPKNIDRAINALTARHVIIGTEFRPQVNRYRITDFEKADGLRRRQRQPSVGRGADSPSVETQYDVVLSFAGEDREIARDLAIRLKGKGVAVFFDEFEQAILWGKNLYDYLSDLYENRAAYCIMLCSESYAQKLWTNRERQAAQARAFRENREYILPVRIDDTRIPGIEETVGYMSLADAGIGGIVDAVLSKVGNLGGDSSDELSENEERDDSDDVPGIRGSDILDELSSNWEELAGSTKDIAKRSGITVTLETAPLNELIIRSDDVIGESVRGEIQENATRLGWQVTFGRQL